MSQINENQIAGRASRPAGIAATLRSNPGASVEIRYSETEGQFTVGVKSKEGTRLALGMERGGDDVLLCQVVREIFDILDISSGVMPEADEACLADVIRRLVAAVGNHGKGLNDGKSGL